MTLSIITVNLNNREGLQRTIDSVVSQTFTDYEWIVIDGGSTDGSRELIEQYADHFAYWCSEPDKGIYNAMNKGIAHAKGEWLQFLNSGDWLYEDTTLEKVFAKEYEAEILYGNAIVQIDNKSYYRKYPKLLSFSDIVYHPINHQASFYKRSLFNDHLFNEEHLIISDYIYLIELALNNNVFEHVDLTIVYSDGNGISSTKIGVDEKNETTLIIPDLIQRDLDELRRIEEHNLYINSHRIYKLIKRTAYLKIKIVEKIVNICEKIRIRIKRK